MFESRVEEPFARLLVQQELSVFVIVSGIVGILRAPGVSEAVESVHSDRNLEKLVVALRTDDRVDSRVQLDRSCVLA